jgi:hypothetical protein
MKPRIIHDRAARAENLRDGLCLALESLTWLAAWALLPAWLAVRGSSIADFVAYVAVSGSLLALGVAADRGRAFQGPGHLVWFTGMTCAAILLFGGTVFAVAHLLLRVTP